MGYRALLVSAQDSKARLYVYPEGTHDVVAHALFLEEMIKQKVHVDYEPSTTGEKLLENGWRLDDSTISVNQTEAHRRIQRDLQEKVVIEAKDVGKLEDVLDVAVLRGPSIEGEPSVSKAIQSGDVEVLDHVVIGSAPEVIASAPEEIKSSPE